MSEWSANNQGRTEAVWSRLVGCYGDSLIRKFGELPPREWSSAIDELNDYQLRQGMRRMKFSGKPHPPSLPEFLKLCRTVGHTDDMPDRPALPRHPALEGPQMGPWEMLGNRRLLKYITTKVPQDPKRYGDPPVPSNPKFAANVDSLVAMKNRWVSLMLEDATEEGVPIADQEFCWNECMKQAERVIANAA